MTTNDIISLSLSTFAVIISIVSFIYPLKKVSKLTLRLVNAVENFGTTELTMTYFIGNIGNVEWYLNEAKVLIYLIEKQEEYPIGNFATDGIPVVIQSNKVNLIKIHCALTAHMYFDASLNSTVSVANLEDKKYGVYLRLDFLSPSGKSLSYLGDVKDLLTKHYNRKPEHFQSIHLDKIDISSSRHKVIRE